jgi:hypothetical protein
MKSNDDSVRLSVAITAASILAAQSSAAKPLKDFEDIILAARNAGLKHLELEARLALAEVELTAGRRQAGLQRLQLLETEALTRGFKYIADRAAAARRKIPLTAA